MATDLFAPLTLRDCTLRNRIAVSPMCQYSCTDRDGLATEWHRVHLGSRAVGGAGLVMAEATAVEPRGRITPQDLGLWSDEHADRLAPIAAFVREQGAVPGVQLAHAGRKASKTRPWEGSEPLAGSAGWTTVGPTAEPWPYDDPPATERLDREGIDAVVAAFADAAERARRAGFEVVEVHAAHGYLLHEFCSPVTNTRTDAYGGSFENRTRLVREVVTAVRDRWPDDRPLFVRVSATDWIEGGWTVADTVRLAEDLEALGVDLIDVSGGGIAPDSAPPRDGPHYMVPLAETVGEAGLPVGAVGKITTPSGAAAVVDNDRADLVFVGREHLRDPYFAIRAALEFGVEPPVPPQYDRGFPTDQ